MSDNYLSLEHKIRLVKEASQENSTLRQVAHTLAGRKEPPKDFSVTSSNNKLNRPAPLGTERRAADEDDKQNIRGVIKSLTGTDNNGPEAEGGGNVKKRISLEHAIRTVHEGLLHKGDKFAPKGDTAIFRSGPTGKGSDVGDDRVSNLDVNKISAAARNKVLSKNDDVVEGMSDMGNVSAQQNVSYSEGGKKKKQLETEGGALGALDTGARLLIPGYDAYQELKAGNFGRAALSAGIDLGAAALTPITGGASWLGRTALKGGVRAGEHIAVSGAGKAAVKGAEQTTAKSAINPSRIADAADLAVSGSNLSTGSSGSSAIPGALTGVSSASLAPQPTPRKSTSSTRSRKLSPNPKPLVKEDSTVPNEGNAPSVASLSAAGAPQEESGKKKKLKEESGTADRRTIENVARPNSANSPFDRKSKLAKNSEIKQKVIDENVRRLSTVREAIEYKKQQDIEEGIGDILKGVGNVASNVVSKLGSGLRSVASNVVAKANKVRLPKVAIETPSAAPVEPDAFSAKEINKDIQSPGAQLVKGFALGVTGQAYSPWTRNSNTKDPKDPKDPNDPKKSKPPVNTTDMQGVVKPTSFAPGKKPMSEGAPENTIHTIRKNTIMGAVADKKRASKETPVEFNPPMKKPDPNSTAS